MFCARVFRVAIVAVLVVRVGLFAGKASADTAEAKKIFTQRCMACHTFGKGVKIGPDLKGVNERRQRAWLLKFVRGSAAVIDSGDPIAVELFTQFKQQRMPDWTDLSEAQVGSILDWLGINGPDQQEADVRLAELATAAEIDTGRQLFHGGLVLTNGGSACGSCHSIRDGATSSGGTLAPDLTATFSAYQDTAMTLFLKHPCFLRFPESQSAAFLTSQESFAIKAYLRQATVAAQAGTATVPTAGKPVDDPARGSGSAAAGAVVVKPGPPTKRVIWAPQQGPKPTGIGRGTRLEGELLFLAFPYAALLVFLIGLGVRHALARRDLEAMKTTTSSAWQLFSGATAWRAGVAVTVILHVLGLLVPRSILGWNAAPVRLYLLEGSGFLFGAVALAGWVQIMWRHLGRTTSSARASLSEIADCVFLSVLCMSIVSGLITAVLYRWGSSWGAETLAPYIASLLRGAPATGLVEEMPFLVRLHVFSWFVVLALVPFTSASMILVSAGDRVLLTLARPVGAVGRAGRRVAGRLSPARWLWPEEDAIDVAGGSDNAQEPS
jgi:nitrate reductase gamma subunit